MHELISKLHLRTMKIWKLYSVGQSPKVAAHATEWRRVLGLARSIGACVKMCKKLEIISDKKKRVRSRACALTRRTTAAYIYKQKIPLEQKWKPTFLHWALFSPFTDIHKEKYGGNAEGCHDEIGRSWPQIAAEDDWEDIGIEGSGRSCSKQFS